MPADPVRRRALRRILARRPKAVTALAFALVGYFGYHIIDGDRGWLAWQRVQVELEAGRAELARLERERAELEHRVTLLRRTSLDPDLLDERARAMLSLVGPDDVIVLLNDREGPRLPGR